MSDVLLKGKQRPIGYITPGGYKKTAKGWRKVSSGSKGSSSKPAVAGSLSKISKDEIKSLVQSTIQRDRLVKGQSVKYVGKYDKGYSGKVGKLLGVGKGGAAVIRFDDGHITYSRWKNVKAQGKMLPFSVFDSLKEGEVYSVAGSELNKSALKAYNRKIAGSKVSVHDIYDHLAKKGFSMFLVGGSVRDFLQGKDSKDLDFIVSCNENELVRALDELDPSLLKSEKFKVLNKTIGLVTFKGLDFTPIHLHDKEVGSLKGGTLKDDALSRDFTMNSLQLDPAAGILVDATGTGLKDAETRKLRFANESILKDQPHYLLRYFKFAARGYKTSATTKLAVLKNLKYIKQLSSLRIEKFLQRQVAEKDGKVGLDKFRDLFMSVDKQLWNSKLELSYRKIRGGM